MRLLHWVQHDSALRIALGSACYGAPSAARLAGTERAQAADSLEVRLALGSGRQDLREDRIELVSFVGREGREHLIDDLEPSLLQPADGPPPPGREPKPDAPA